MADYGYGGNANVQAFQTVVGTSPVPLYTSPVTDISRIRRVCITGGSADCYIDSNPNVTTSSGRRVPANAILDVTARQQLYVVAASNCTITGHLEF